MEERAVLMDEIGLIIGQLLSLLQITPHHLHVL